MSSECCSRHWRGFCSIRGTIFSFLHRQSGPTQMGFAANIHSCACFQCLKTIPASAAICNTSLSPETVRQPNALQPQYSSTQKQNMQQHSISEHSEQLTGKLVFGHSRSSTVNANSGQVLPVVSFLSLKCDSSRLLFPHLAHVAGLGRRWLGRPEI